MSNKCNCPKGFFSVLIILFDILKYFIIKNYFDWQEVLLKRAADLLEMFYGMPHTNQVNITFRFTQACYPDMY